MKINILIVDGNEKKSSDIFSDLGIKTQYEEYRDTLQKIASSKLNIQVIHPAIDDFLPQNINLDIFHGIVWTGSTLNIYDQTPSIIRQIELAKLLLSKKNKIFGSCWGLQVLTTAAGGNVNKNMNGLEAIISKKIILNNNGQSHKMYANKPKKFDAFCWHYDEVKSVPNDSIILASNEHSKIQALTFKNNQSEFWGVQYHPEFTPNWIHHLMNLRKDILLDKNVFNNEKEFNKISDNLLKLSTNENFSTNLGFDESIFNENIRFLEIENWLNFLSHNI